jgi:hypothetical protein
MTEAPKPTSKFRGRLGAEFSQFGNSTEASETEQEEQLKAQTVLKSKAQTSKNAKRQKPQEQQPGTEGKTFYLMPDLHRWLKAYAAFNDKSMSDVVTEELEKLRRKNPLGQQ